MVNKIPRFSCFQKTYIYLFEERRMTLSKVDFIFTMSSLSLVSARDGDICITYWPTLIFMFILVSYGGVSCCLCGNKLVWGYQ